MNHQTAILVHSSSNFAFLDDKCNWYPLMRSFLETVLNDQEFRVWKDVLQVAESVLLPSRGGCA